MTLEETIAKKRGIEVVDLDKDFDASAKRLEELKAGRNLDDIPFNDPYFKAVRKHRMAHNKK